MKRNLFFLFLSIALIGYSQIPSYYNDVNLSLSGQALKNALSTKVTNSHTNFLSYTPGVWNALQQTDLDPTDPNKVLLIYGWNDTDSDITNDRSRGVNQNGGNTGDWNREHVYPRSLGNPNLGSEGPGSDAHSLRPCDGQRNSSRSNRKFAAGSGNSGTTPQGHWYPGDEWKGDVARMMMYMYIRYGNRTLPTNVGVGNPVSGDADMIDLFLQWNAEDPVSDFEKQRNPVLEGLQGNRNPFIDNPAFATQIWGGPQAEDLFGSTGGGNDTIAPSIPTGLIANNITTTTTQLSWNASSDNVGVTVYEVYQNGTFLVTVSATNHTVAGLAPNTTYSYTVLAKDAAGNASATSTAISVTTQNTSAGGNATDLFFSEYIEGSSFNKAVEIANFTGGTINLSGYAIKKQTNGSGAWSGGLDLTGAVINGEVFVIAHSSASSAVTAEADVTVTSTQVTFNGNDAVGLFKNDVLIDIIGTFNGGNTNFAKDVTLVRKASVVMPSTTYDVAEWNTLSRNTFTDLGTHTFDGGGGATPDTEVPTAPANLVAANITVNSASLSWTAATDNIGVTAYDVYQDGTVIGSTANTNYSVTGLNESTSYTFNVRANDAAGNQSATSNTVSITTETPADTQAPTVPGSLTANNITQNALNLSWTASSDNIGVTGYEVRQNGILLGQTTATAYAISGLTASTTYTFEVVAIDAANNTSTAASVTATTLNDVLTYCTARGNNVNFEFIDFVGIGGISNSTGANGGYVDFTSQVGNLPYGSNTIVLSIGFVSTSYTENWGVWIDFNKNGSFESSEKVVTGSTSNAGNLSYSFNVPSTAIAGTTRMRVAMKWNGTPTACETFAYGEVEDYTVNIGASVRLASASLKIDGTLTKEEKLFAAAIYPNPASSSTTIRMKDDRAVSYRLINMLGQVVRASNSTRENINLEGLRSGIYVVEINDGQRNIQQRLMIK